MLPTARLVAALFLFTTAYPAIAEEVSTRNYPLRDHGVLQLQVPKSWQEKIRQPPDKHPPTFIFTPASGATFQVVITPLWPASSDIVLPSLEKIRAATESEAARVEPQSVEGTVKIQELKGPAVEGYYFSVTDKAPPTGEFKYMTQGTLQLMNLLVTFAVVTNDGGDEVVPASLEMLKKISHIPTLP